jgi:hypothetical protein
VTVPSGARRLLISLDPRDLRDYERAIAAAVAPIERSLGGMVRANRADHTGPRPYGPAAAAWHADLRELAGRPGVVITSDVRRCYRSIGPAAVERGLRRAGVDPQTRGSIAGLLAAFGGAGIEGLPVGPWPSGVLANAVLAVADDTVAAEGATIARWVDDVIIAGPSTAVARAGAAWRRALHDLGLLEHEGKRFHGPCDAILGARVRSGLGGSSVR